MSQKGIRRDFRTGSAAVSSLFTFVTKSVFGQAGMASSANDKLNIACIGVGGMGASDVGSVSSENIIALCDVDENHAAATFNKFPNARKYKDFRIMLEKEAKNIDAVTVSTPVNCVPRKKPKPVVTTKSSAWAELLISAGATAFT
jgi:hypothetical protein